MTTMPAPKFIEVELDDWRSTVSERNCLRSENQRLREEMTRAANWMEDMAVREKAASFRKGYAVRIAAARAVLKAT